MKQYEAFLFAQNYLNDRFAALLPSEVPYNTRKNYNLF